MTQRIAIVVIMAFVNNMIYPFVASALTGGPAQPEFSEFEPVGTTNMVNEFTGDFTYNLPVLSIPGPDGAGYALSLSYHSGKTGEDEASWVGKGWTLNPGAIMRNKRGFADDSRSENVHYLNNVDPNWTKTASKKLGAEVFSNEIKLTGLTGSLAARFNNYKGYSRTYGIGLDIMGVADLGYSCTNGEGTYSWSVSPSRILNLVGKAFSGNSGAKTEEQVRSAKDFFNRSLGKSLGHDVIASFGETVRSLNFPSYTGSSIIYESAVEADFSSIQIGAETGITGTSSIQSNWPFEDVKTYGYMYSGHLQNDDDAMDYYVEKDAPYNSRDRLLGIPFANVDNFIVSGEGIGGGFRAYNRTIGQFRPAHKESSTKISQVGGDLHVGSDIGFGVTYSESGHKLTMKGWDDKNNNVPYKFSTINGGDEPISFRFTNDPGGSVEFGPNDNAVRAEFPMVPVASLMSDGVNSLQNSRIKAATVKGLPYVIPTSKIAPIMDAGHRNGRASYIGYHTNKQMIEQPALLCYGASGPSYIKSYNKADSSRHFVYRPYRGGADYFDYTDPIADGIGEFGITNPNGMRYVYGLPVYSRNEKDLGFVVDGAVSTDGYTVYKPCALTPDQKVVGEERNAPYATSFLLTEITTPDYVDRTNDGPSVDDLGGYTKFNYSRAAGTDNKVAGDRNLWYKWRNPYNGMLYNRNSLSDKKDDLGSVSYGEKEIYYVSSIETKTHIAFFYTSPRQDGYEAGQNEAQATNDISYPGVGQTDINKLRRLDKIELYVKTPEGGVGKKISTTHFKYSYDLCHNLPNAQSGGGALTLTQVYFEYDGVVNARISPYVFGYDYKKSTTYSVLPSVVKAKYAKEIAFADPLIAGSENPNYSVTDIDRWGSYRYKGIDRSKIFNPWVDQHPDPTKFDPAAWQLKWIQLPSGAEIHIQYEQNDYRYVQNRPVMAMASLKPEAGNGSNIASFTLNLEALYGSSSDPQPVTHAEAVATADEIRRRFVNGGELMYFKFLFSLLEGDPNLTNCSSEFITGWTKVLDVVPGNTDVTITLNSPASGNDPLDMDQLNGNVHPRDIARAFVATSRAGIVDKYGSCDPTLGPIFSADPQVGLWELYGTFANTYFDAEHSATKFNPDYSYFRIPFVRDKKGGGIRVKRLLMFDKGIENGAAALYGTEYKYVLEDGRSSGVATNEPQNGREENPLVEYLKKREDQSGYSQDFAGYDREEFEGPIGESILPAPSIGYSRVVEQNIHTGSTTTGYSVHEFYTAFDYPYDGNVTRDGVTGRAVDETPIDPNDSPLTLPIGIGIIRMDDRYRLQGYRFVLNNMHGKVKRVAAYGGDPSANETRVPITDESFEYFQPGERIPVMDGFGHTVDAFPGREEEVTMESRSTESSTTRGGGLFDLTWGGFILPIPSVGIDFTYDDESMQTHVISRVIRYPAIVKSTRTVKDGVEHKVEYLAFDPQSGNPILTRETDGHNGLPLAGSGTAGHDGSYYSYTLPAYQKYPAMGQIAMREGRVIRNADGVVIEKRYTSGEHHLLNFLLGARGASAYSIDLLTPGDLVRLTGTGGEFEGVYYVGRIAGNQVELLPTYSSNVNTQPLQSMGSVEILRSGRKNQLDESAGSITTYGQMPSPVDHSPTP